MGLPFTIDRFYASEIHYLNDETSKKDTTILFFGDSFTAQQAGYINILRKQFPAYRLINSAVPGTGAQEMSYMSSGRIKKYTPTAVVIQLYVGNDLLDIRHPVNWEKLTYPRNIYWWLSDRSHVLRWVNYKLGQFKSGMATSSKKQADAKIISQFSLASYSPRIKMYLNAEPAFLYNSIHLGDERLNEFDELITNIKKIIQSYDTKTKTIVVIVPHCSQLNEFYHQAYLSMGADLPAFNEHSKIDYPFIQNIRQSLDTLPNITIVNPLPGFKI